MTAKIPTLGLRLAANQAPAYPCQTVRNISEDIADRVFKGHNLDDPEFRGTGGIAIELLRRDGKPVSNEELNEAINDALTAFRQKNYRVDFTLRADGTNVIVLTAPNHEKIDRLLLDTVLTTVYESKFPYYFAIAWKRKS